MRNNLIMHFHCAECGHRLDIAYEKECETAAADKMGPAPIPAEPTGAGCLYTPKIRVKPCRHCIDKHTGPAKQLLNAIQTMAGAD